MRAPWSTCSPFEGSVEGGSRAARRPPAAEWEGALVAYDGSTLKELWRFDTGCGFRAPPISYAVGGKQYIAIAAGPHWTGGTRPAALKYANTCSMVYVFAL